MPHQKHRIRNRKANNQLQNEIAAELNSSDEENIEFYNAMLSAERGIMKLYKEAFKSDPLLDRTYRIFTEDQQVERYAQNLAFWQKLLREYDEDDFESRTSDPKYVYIKMKESEVRLNVIDKFKDDYPELLKRIFLRLLEIVNNTN